MTEGTYRGACHCEAVQFEAPLDLDKTMVCNCSRCQKLGWVMAFAPRARIAITRGEGTTKDYLFHNKKIHHHFCPACGIEPFAFAQGRDGQEMAVINVNCLDGVDPRALTPKAVDGRSL